MTTRTDEELVSLLGGALREPTRSPTEEELARFRAVLAYPQRTQAFPGRRARPGQLLVAALLVLLGGLAATLLRVPLPGPVRSLAVSIGLPVNDARVAGAKGEISAVAAALVAREPARVASAADVLRAALTGLSGPDRQSVLAPATRELAAAHSYLAAAGLVKALANVPRTAPATTTTTTTTTTPVAGSSQPTGTIPLHLPPGSLEPGSDGSAGRGGDRSAGLVVPGREGAPATGGSSNVPSRSITGGDGHPQGGDN